MSASVRTWPASETRTEKLAGLKTQRSRVQVPPGIRLPLRRTAQARSRVPVFMEAALLIRRSLLARSESAPTDRSPGGPTGIALAALSLALTHHRPGLIVQPGPHASGKERVL